MPTTIPDSAFTPHGTHELLWRCRDERVLVVSAAGTGKTRNILERLNYLCWRYPESRHLICRKTRASMSESVLVTWERDVHAHDMHLFGTATRAHREAYQYPNGSIVGLGGLDNPVKLYSTEWDTVYVPEATETTVEEIEPLLRAMRSRKMVYGPTGQPWHQIVLDGNPEGERHWLKLRADAGWFTYFHPTIKDNPVFWDEATDKPTPAGEAYIRNLEALTGHRRARLLEGRWCSSEGVVYQLDYGRHVIDRMPAGWEKWKKWRAIDFGYNDPFVCQWWADSGEAMYLYREIYMSGRIVEDHARQIVALSQGETITATVADHAREDRETLHRHGVRTIPAMKEIERGIDAVRARLAVGGNGVPRLYILRSALVERDAKLAALRRPVSTLEEFDAYTYASRRDGSAKDLPIDANNHGMDAMRYAVMMADSPRPAAAIRVVTY